VLGWDVAGEVVATGQNVTRFKQGDRVVGLAAGQDKSVNEPAEGAFQTYTLLRDHMVTPIPAAMTYEQASVLPLAVSTAACGLFQADQLGLTLPTEIVRPTGEIVLVWGGSTSVGSNAIQLARAAGYEVITTASPRNHAYVHDLGAMKAFDYKSSTVVRDIVRALQGRTLAGALAIGAGSAAACIDIAGASRGKKFVAVASPPVSFDDAPAGGGNRLWLAGKLVRLVIGYLGMMLRARRRGVRFKFINGSSLLDDGLGRTLWSEYLPRSLASGRHRAVPEPFVAGVGLSAIPEALAMQKKGVSAKKIVVTL